MKWARVISTDNKVCYITPTDNGKYVEVLGNPLTNDTEVTSNEIVPQQWLPPVDPPAILCIGLNYFGHAQETHKPIPQYPVVFMKNPGAITGHLQPICIPQVCHQEVDYEGELVIIIGRDTLNVPRSEAYRYIAGLTIGNDVSARKWQMEWGGGQWVRGKSFDSFAPVGPLVIPLSEVETVNSMKITTYLNDNIVQEALIGDMIFDIFELVTFLSQGTTLKQGTVIFTGTPAGVGWAKTPPIYLKHGDVVTIEITPIGKLINPVIEVSKSILM